MEPRRAPSHLTRATAGLFIAAFCTFARTAAGQSRTVTGTVIDAETREPLAGALVLVKGSMIRTAAGDSGRFVLLVPAADITLHVRRIGYLMQHVPVASARETVTVAMRKDALRLDQVVVTGHATGVSRRHAANAIEVVSSEELTRVPAPTIERALQGKIAGAQIYQNSGAPGGGSRVLIRGSSSINGSVSPLYVVDGMIVSDRAIAPGLNKVTRAGGGGAITSASQEDPVNRIADISPDDIESIEVLKGSSAAAIYGSKASAGVILITTKRGLTGRPRFTVRSSVGTSRLAYQRGIRQYRTLQDARAQYDAGNAWGDSVWAVIYDATRSFDHEELLYGQKPTNHESSVTVNGGSGATRFFISAQTKRDEGIIGNTFAHRTNARVNLDQDFGARTTLALGSTLVRGMSDRGLTGNENAPGGGSVGFALQRIPSFYDFRPLANGLYPQDASRFWTSNPYQTIALFQNEERVWRSINTARLTRQLILSDVHDLRFVAHGGIDFLQQQNYVYSPPELEFENDDLRIGAAVVSESRDVLNSLQLNAVYVAQPRAWASVTSQIGTQYESRAFESNRILGENLLGGVTRPSGASFRDFSSERQDTYDFGLFLQSEALFWDRLLLTAGLRADRSSNNGDPGKMYSFPKFAASYRLPMLLGGANDEMKVRLAYGETGNRPGFGAKSTTLQSSSIGGQTGLGLSPTRGSPDIRPERQRELEGGVDLALFSGRADFGVTAFERNVSDLLLNRTVPPSLGFSSQLINGGDLRVRGFEATVHAFPVKRNGPGALGWNASFRFGLNRTRVMKLVEPLPPFGAQLGHGQVYVQVGHSLTKMIGSDTVSIAGTCPPRPVDPTGCAALAVGAVYPVYVGDASPKYNAGLGNRLSWKGAAIYAMLERQKGGTPRLPLACAT